MTRSACRLTLLVVLVSVLGLRPIHAQAPATEAAQASADAWLSLLDNQDYAASWATAASAFRAAVTREQWQEAASRARGPLGGLESRVLKSATSATTLPGAPDGEYVVLQFTTAFEHKAAAVETVTAIREADGTWHVGGYFVR